MGRAFWLSVIGVLIAWPCAAKEPLDHFDRVIAPLLAQRCLDCHQGPTPEGGLDLSQRDKALAGGDSGAAIVASDLGKSVLWERVAAGEMPPKKPLPEAEREIIKAWIASGAKWGTEKIDPFRFTTDKRAGYDWWSLQPSVRPSVPTLTNDWPRHNAIDAFVQAKLLSAGLEPSPLIERSALLRRLSFDLLGLPPEQHEVASFVADRSASATDQLIDRLLASPHYGERWARHWLDVARFGESQGFERDKLRTNSWRYRDWVVDALNRDLPFRDFVRYQLAGDTLAPEDPALVAASGFLVAGPFDEVGKTQQSAAMKAVVRQDELEDFVSVVGQSFLGLTVNCARCHDHKFDPILQREYYQLAASLAGVEHGQRNLKAEKVQQRVQQATSALAARRQQLIEQLAGRERDIRAQLIAERKERPEKLAPPTPLAEWTFDSDAHDVQGKLHGQLQAAALLKDGQLHVDGKSAHVLTAPLEKELTAKTLVAWVKLGDLAQRGGGVIGVQTRAGDQFDAIVFGELDPKHWMAGSDFFKRTKSFSAPEDNDADKTFVQIAITYAADGTIAAYRNGQPYGAAYKADSVITFKPGDAQVMFGVRHSPVGGNKMLRGAIDRALLFDRALTAKEVAALAGSDEIPQSEVLARFTEPERQQRAQVQFEIDQLADMNRRWQEMNTYAVVSHTPHPVQVLARGEPNKPLGEVTPGGIASLGTEAANFNLNGQAPDAARRQKLAEWIVAEQNPLAARVLVNRLWHYHFGAGLVETPNDFGFNGARPSHPELLDWLAAEFLASGGSIKHIQRLIVSSATYQQGSLPVDKAMQQDAGNRLLWRRSPQRLNAETIRDTILVASGRWNREFGGPGYHDFRTFVANSQFYEIVDVVGQTFERRSLYRTWIRSGRSPLLDTFDCPDPSTKTPARTVTTTPLQALSLLNNAFILRMSDVTAQRVAREVGDDLNQQVPRLYELLLQRQPSVAERKLTGVFVSEHSLAALARVLMNSNEFLYVD